MLERKKELRSRIAELKAQHSSDSLQALSAATWPLLERLPLFEEAATVLLYHSLKDEVESRSFLDRWSHRKRILLPVVKKNELELRLYTGAEGLVVSSAFGIAEPTGEPFTDYDSIDLAIIPGVAFDAAGHRLGRGKGYYDRLLPQIHAPKIGICFPFQLLAEVPIEPFDVPMDGVICLAD